MSDYQKLRGRMIGLEMDRATGAPSIELLPLEVLEPDPLNHRHDLGNKETDSPHSKQAFQELVESIKTNGLTDPIKALPPESASSKFRIRDGHRRYYAAIQAGLTEVDVIVRHRDTSKLRVEQVISNVMQERPNHYEIAIAIQQALDAGTSPEDIANAVGKTRTWVANYRAILKYPEDIQVLLRTGRLRAINTARELASISDSGARAAAIAELDSGVTPRFSKKLADTTSSDGPASESLPEEKKAKRAKPIGLHLTPAQAELLLQYVRTHSPELFEKDIPHRSREAIAFRKMVLAVVERLIPGVKTTGLERVKPSSSSAKA